MLLILISVFIACMTSCGGKKTQQAPDDLISRDKMMDIIVEAWILENSINYWYKDTEETMPVTIGLYADLFERYHISKEQFIQSSDYYLKNDPNAEDFVHECLQRLEERKGEFTAGSDQVSQPQ